MCKHRACFALQKLFDKLQSHEDSGHVVGKDLLVLPDVQQGLAKRPAKGASNTSQREAETIKLGGAANTILGRGVGKKRMGQKA